MTWTKTKISIWLLLFLCSLNYVHTARKRIRLQDIEVLTLRDGERTTSYRSSSVPQLKCISSSNVCRNRPRVVQCLNAGWDGIDVQWKCTGELDTGVSFGKLMVTCEGYDYADDPYVLAGSCGLEYELIRNDRREETYKVYESNDDSSGFYFWLIFTCIVIFLLLKSCLQQNATAGPIRNNPPPPYNPYDGYPNIPPYDNNEYCRPAASTGYQSGSGFWTGLGLGGILGSLFSSSNNNSRRAYSRTAYTQRTRIVDESDDDVVGSSNSHSSRTATGYAGTRRR